MPVHPIHIIFIIIGVVWIAGALLFRNRIDAFYNNVEDLDEKRKRYAKRAIYIPGLVFLAMGLYFFAQSYPYFYALTSSINWNFILGCFALGYGIFTLFVRLFHQEERFFIKKKAGIDVMHIIAYTVVPILFGTMLLLGIISIRHS